MTNLHKAIASAEGPILGAAIHRYNLSWVEMCAAAGLGAVWVDMEHCAFTFAETADICRLIQALGMLAMIRIPDTARNTVLQAAECAPNIIDLPMANTLEDIQSLVANALYAPLGSRGFYGSSRAQKYGKFANILDEQARINQELCLMAQIETREALDNAKQFCSIPELGSLMIGPGDLSVALGIPAQTNHAVVQEAAGKVVNLAHEAGKIATIACSAKDVTLWAEIGFDLIFFCSDTGCLKNGLEQMVAEIKI